MIRLMLASLAALSLFAQDKPRVFITDSASWEIAGGFGAAGGAGAGQTRGGARPQTVEIMKTFSERCPGVTVTINRDRADYIVLLDHEGGKPIVLRDNKIAVFKADGDMLYTDSTRSLGNAVKEACSRILPAK